VLRVLCLAWVLVFAGGESRAQITGTVRDSAGKRIAGASIALVGAVGASATSNDSGSFRVSGVRGGSIRLFARRLGFLPETVSVDVGDDGSGHVDFRLTTAPASLQGEVIEADPLRGKMAGFNRRKSRGVGSFITRDEIERRSAPTLSELLRHLPGVGVQQRMAGEPQPIRMQRSTNSSMQASCTVQIYVDGHPYPNGNVDDFSPRNVEGVEVYKSASEIPADFRARDASCGVIAIWTRDPDAARRRP